ncbi:hypothetical protein [Salinicoccus roseus]|uniref:hypothetical protein n=1 Tax=Salinicoccus roseus TaxID=45670 RepID=UPI003DA13767
MIKKKTKRELYDIFQQDVKPLLDRRNGVSTKYQTLKKEYEAKRKELHLLEATDDYIAIAKLKKEIGNLADELAEVSDELLNADSDYKLDDEVKSEIKDSFRAEVDDAQLEISMLHDAIMEDMDAVAKRYEQIVEAQRKVVKARKLYNLMDETVINENMEHVPSGNKLRFRIMDAMKWDADGYSNQFNRNVPDTSLNAMKRKMEDKLKQAKLNVFRKFRRK